MNETVSTGIEEREQWRARILRALAELRGDDHVLRGQHGDEEREDGSAE